MLSTILLRSYRAGEKHKIRYSDAMLLAYSALIVSLL